MDTTNDLSRILDELRTATDRDAPPLVDLPFTLTSEPAAIGGIMTAERYRDESDQREHTMTNRIGKLIVNRAGHTSGIRHGEIYTAPTGARGFVAVIRTRQTGDQMLYVEHFDTLAQAAQYLVDRDAY